MNGGALPPPPPQVRGLRVQAGRHSGSKQTLPEVFVAQGWYGGEFAQEEKVLSLHGTVAQGKETKQARLHTCLLSQAKSSCVLPSTCLAPGLDESTLIRTLFLFLALSCSGQIWPAAHFGGGNGMLLQDLADVRGRQLVIGGPPFRGAAGRRAEASLVAESAIFPLSCLKHPLFVFPGKLN